MGTSSVRHGTMHIDESVESYPVSRLDRKKTGDSKLSHGGNSNGAARVNRKISTADTGSAIDDVGADLERRSTESDRKSQQGTQELVIREDVQFDVKHEPAKKGSEGHRPGLLCLPK